MRRIQRIFALDLGSSVLRLCVDGEEQVTSVPSVAAVNSSGAVVARGARAHSMRGRAPAHVDIVHPIARGAVVHQQLATRLLYASLRDSGPRHALKDCYAAVCVPDEATPLQRRALAEVCHEAGLSRVRLIPKSLADLVGLGLPIHEPTGALLVDVGVDRASVSMMSMGHATLTRTGECGGRSVNLALIRHLRTAHGLTVGDEAAEDAKIRLRALTSADEHILVRGKDLTDRAPRSQLLPLDEVAVVTGAVCDEVARLVQSALEDSPSELAHDVLDRGILLIGRGALLPGLAGRLREAIDIPVHQVGLDGTTGVLGAHRLAQGAAQHERERGHADEPSDYVPLALT
ncbi:rod shape-determining protein [Streptomyces apocyni]|uniref:rod shape-determining protein n=1 Tax=Streptomyces apocyni TaxID=2654677 RepID=UPI0012E9E3AE|nr:rod shape-determining protein [Streptomyces apocyni]